MLGISCDLLSIFILFRNKTYSCHIKLVINIKLEIIEVFFCTCTCRTNIMTIVDAIVSLICVGVIIYTDSACTRTFLCLQINTKHELDVKIHKKVYLGTKLPLSLEENKKINQILISAKTDCIYAVDYVTDSCYCRPHMSTFCFVFSGKFKLIHFIRNKFSIIFCKLECFFS